MDATIGLTTICVPSDEVVARIIEDDMILVPLTASIGDSEDELYTLNQTGKVIWNLLDGQRNLSEVAELISECFFTPDGNINQDVLGFAAELVRRGILTIKDTTV